MIVVFAGPTIGHPQVQQQLDCVCLPPASHGDIIRLMADPPRAIGIIDGYFEGAPSVWHKEILYALDQGVHVFGAASMGALRAAELDGFGMVGVGQVYQWYRDDVIEDDDEVAVLHGPDEVGFAVASEPMVNIRACLDLALQQKVISASLSRQLLDSAKATFYKGRSWRGILDGARASVHQQELDRLQTWLEDHAIDLKQQDAMAMLELMAERREQFNTPFRPRFQFEWTHVWDTAFNEHGGKKISLALSELENRILDELRLEPDDYQHYRQCALLAWLGNTGIETNIELADTRRALAQFRQRNGLATREQLSAYMKAADMNEQELTRILENAARLDKVEELATADPQQMSRLIIDQLKLGGRYQSLADRIQCKQAAGVYKISARGEWGVRRPQLLSWYFIHQCESLMPDDLGDHLGRIDLADPHQFYTLIGAEYLYHQTETQNK